MEKVKKKEDEFEEVNKVIEKAMAKDPKDSNLRCFAILGKKGTKQAVAYCCCTDIDFAHMLYGALRDNNGLISGAATALDMIYHDIQEKKNEKD